MTAYEIIMLVIAFASLIIALLDFLHKRKNGDK